MDWCDSNQHRKILSNETSARAAFRCYVDELKRLVSQNLLSNNTATGYQNSVLYILQDFLNVENLDRGVNILVKSQRIVEPTTVPDDASQEKVLAWCKCLFNGLTELVVDQKHYPFPLTVPGYLSWPDDRLWVFPLSGWCLPPGHKNKRNFQAYDFSNGTVRTYQEIKRLYKNNLNDSLVYNSITNANKFIEESNRDFFKCHRIEMGMLAVKAFLMIFIASTGSNPSQVVELPWSEELEDSVRSPLSERQGFRAIKYRANNRAVFFELGIKYMPYLRRYLQLRNYLLNGRSCEYLFFGFSRSMNCLENDPTPLLVNIIPSFFDTLKRLTPTLPRVVPKQWRAAKQDYLIRNHDPVTSAIIMQHSTETSIKKYSNGSEVAHQIELSTFLNQVEKIVLKQDQKIEGSEVRSIGICASPRHPQAIVDHLPLTPDCKGPEGCLFCDKYRVHADETDARKLLSARYCIKITSHLASSQEQFARLFGSVLKRIDFVLGEIKRRDTKMVEKIELEVDIHGELDPFWAAKLETLMELELV